MVDSDSPKERDMNKMKYNVIDVDPAMQYEPGDEVIGSVEADTAYEAIDKVMKAIGVDVLKAYSSTDYAKYILQHVKAVEAAE